MNIEKIEPILSEKGYANFMKICESVLPRYEDTDAKLVYNKIKKCIFVMTPIERHTISRSDFDLKKDSKGNTSIEKTVKEIPIGLEKEISELLSQINQSNFSNCDNTEDSLEKLQEKTKKIEENIQFLMEKVKRLKELEEGEIRKEEEQKKGFKSFGGLVSDEKFRVKLYGDNGKETVFRAPKDVEEDYSLKQENDDRANYLQAKQDLSMIIQKWGNYQLEERHIKKITSDYEDEMFLYKTLGVKYLKMKIAFSKMLARSAKEIIEHDKTDSLPELKEFKNCDANSDAVQVLMTDSFASIINKENFVRDQIHRPLTQEGVAAIEKIGILMDIITTQLNGQKLDRFIKNEDGRFMSINEIHDVLFNGSSPNTTLQIIAYQYITNYISNNHIKLPEVNISKTNHKQKK